MDYYIIRRLYFTGFLILTLVLFYYQVIRGRYFLDKAKNNYVRVIPQRAIRGIIFDRNAIPIAYDKASFNLAVIPYQIGKRKDRLFVDLARFLKCNPETIIKNYKKNLSNIISPVDIVFDINKIIALEAKEAFGDDILINSQPKRFYPYAYECAHILGYLREESDFTSSFKKYNYFFSNQEGVLGIEKYYDDNLQGEDGGYFLEVGAKGNVLGFLGEKDIGGGKDLYLTIDYRMQKIGYEILGDRIGVIILMAAQTGEILCLNSSPSFNPNNFIKGKDVRQFLDNKANPMLNRAIQVTYPLGSIFKPLEGLAALEENKITMTNTFICNGTIDVGGKKFNCLGVHREQDLTKALTHSCNIYFYNLGQILGVNILSFWAKKFGLDFLTGIDLAYEKKGFVPSLAWKAKTIKEPWYTGDTVNFSIGQGYMLASPMQALIAINIFAAEGYLVKPHILKNMELENLVETNKIDLKLSLNNISNIKQGLIDVVNAKDGTANVLSELGLNLAGKTGTAQTKGLAHGWFIGFWPYNQAKYTICIFLENAGSSHESVNMAYSFIKRLKEDNLLEEGR